MKSHLVCACVIDALSLFTSSQLTISILPAVYEQFKFTGFPPPNSGKTPLKRQKTQAFTRVFKCVEAPTRIELVLKILQTSALPLGYGAVYIYRRSEKAKTVQLSDAQGYYTGFIRKWQQLFLERELF